MLRCLGFLLWFSFPLGGVLFATDSEPATKGDLKLVLQALDKRFEQIDKRFEQIDKRFDDLKIFMGLLTTITIAVLSYVMYRIHRIEESREERTSEKLLYALREVAQKDPKIEKALKIVGLL